MNIGIKIPYYPAVLSRRLKLSSGNNNEELQALRFFFDQRTIKEPSSETLLPLAGLLFTLNCFSFADNYYKQVNVVAMGTKMGPSYVNLFVGYIENQFSINLNFGTKPEFYGRYIDDCIGATSSRREELDHFITSVNYFHPMLKYTWEISETSIAFLDIKVSITGNGLSTSVYYKPTDSHSYLLHSSSHPSHVKNSITFSQFLRLRRFCSDDSDFSNKSQEMRHFFKKRGHPDSVVNTAQHLLNKLINNQHCKRHRRKRTREFHLHSLTIHITPQPKTSFQRTLSYSKMTMKQEEPFHSLH